MFMSSSSTPWCAEKVSCTSAARSASHLVGGYRRADPAPAHGNPARDFTRGDSARERDNVIGVIVGIYFVVCTKVGYNITGKTEPISKAFLQLKTAVVARDAYGKHGSATGLLLKAVATELVPHGGKQFIREAVFLAGTEPLKERC